MRNFPYNMVQGTGSISLPVANVLRATEPSIISATTGLSGSFSTSGVSIKFTNYLAVQAIFTGTFNGVLSLGASNNGVVYDTITGSTTGINVNLSGSTGHFTWNIPFPGYHFIQANFVNNGGTNGALQFQLSSKGEGI